MLGRTIKCCLSLATLLFSLSTEAQPQEEALMLDVHQVIQVLCSECVVSSAIGTYLPSASERKPMAGSILYIVWGVI